MLLTRTYLILLFACMADVLTGQISPLADQFLINPFLTNPAFAGIDTKAPLSISARQQWLGIKGAPSWQSATYHSSLNAQKQRFNPLGFVNKGENSFGNVGVGGGLFNVKYGAISQIGLHLDYAYHVYIGKGRLSFGLAPLYQQLIINKSGFIPPDGAVPDPLIDGAVREILHKIDINAGVHYFSDFIFAGFSVVQLFNSSVTFGKLSFTTDSDKNSYLARSLYLYGGITPVLSKNITLEPSVLMKYNGQSGFDFQVHLRTTIYENFQAGLLYHFKESAGFFAGVRVGDLIFRYQFELPLGTAVLTRFTTNQVMVGYLF
ncbi:MAG: type IX secretion system membrane protein PorP/SprF [Bacteroidia bacterium]|nr:type IX secretion system membrane protein PorP/SprF [Bacteroidia bacterium]